MVNWCCENQYTTTQLLKMKDIEKALKEELCKHFLGQGQRLTMMSKLILSVIKMSTVNYSKLALVLNPSVKISSNFKRIQRFFKGYSFCQRCYIQFAWALFGNTGNWIALTMDRTNWKFGKANINILTIGISLHGTAIPLVWMTLNKRGQSNQNERIVLLHRLLNCLKPHQEKRIRYLLMDREFAAFDWLCYLKTMPFHFLIRIRKDAKIRKPGQHKEVSAFKLFLTPNFRVLRKQRIIFGHRLYVAGQQVSKNEFFILISDQPLSNGRYLYAERWGIEVFFGACKKRGFNFEDTHQTIPERINTLIFILAIAFTWALKTGEVRVQAGKKITLKNLKTRKTKLLSLFRIGLDQLKVKLLNFLSLNQEISILSCT